MGLKNLWEDITWKWSQFMYSRLSDKQLRAIWQFIKKLVLRWIPHILLLWGIWNLVLTDLFTVGNTNVINQINLWEACLVYVLTGILFRKPQSKES